MAKATAGAMAGATRVADEGGRGDEGGGDGGDKGRNSRDQCE